MDAISLEPFDWEAAGYVACEVCHGMFPTAQTRGDRCEWCSEEDEAK